MKKYILIGILATLILQGCGRKTTETKPIRKDITETVFAPGVLEAENTYNLTAQVSGYLIAVNFNEGDIIQEGSVLAIIDNKENSVNAQSALSLLNIAESNAKPSAPLLLQAKNNIKTAKQKLEQDSILELRYRKLMETNSVAKVDYENMLLQYKNSKLNYESAVEAYNNQKQIAEQQVITNNASKNVNQIVLGKNEIRAVVSGKVYKKFKQTGDYVKQGDIIAQIGSANHVYAKVNIDESVIEKIKVGQKAFVQLNINKSKVYNASVAEILPAFDEETQSFFCKLYFQDTLDFKIINTQLQSNITVGNIQNALIIPKNYIDYNGYVMIKGKKNKIKIKTGFVSDNWVQILDGIDETTVIVTDNIVDISKQNVETVKM